MGIWTCTRKGGSVSVREGGDIKWFCGYGHGVLYPVDGALGLANPKDMIYGG